MQNETGGVFFHIIKGVGLALAVALLGVVILASVQTILPMQSGVVYTINQVLKLVALGLGVLVFVRGERGFLQGIAIGLLFTALSYLAFSALGGSFALSWLIFIELLLAVVVGGLCGGVAVNLRRE